MNLDEAKAKRARQCWLSEGVWGDMSCRTLADCLHCRNCEIYAFASRKFFTRVRSEKPAASFASMPRAEAAIQTAQAESFFLFEVAKRVFALETKRVLKIERTRLVHRVPHRDGRVVKGIANVGGELMMCVCLEELLEIEASNSVPEESKRMIVCGGGSEKFCFIVDEACGIARVMRDEVATLSAGCDGLIDVFAEKVFTQEGTEIPVIDLKLVMLAVARKHL